MESHAGLIQFEEIQCLRARSEAEFKSQRESEQLRRRIAVRDWLQPVPIEAHQESRAEARQGYPGVCSWIQGQERYLKWKDFQSQSENILWLTGIPGAGMLFYLYSFRKGSD